VGRRIRIELTCPIVRLPDGRRATGHFHQEDTMRFMLIRKADERSEADVTPSVELLDAMSRYNQEMLDAGVLLSGDGLHSSAKGAKVTFNDGKASITDGPFAETKELIAGFTMIQVESLDEAINWVKRWPCREDGDVEIEIRQVHELEDFDNLADHGDIKKRFQGQFGD
jgi:hypothetical protein